MISYGRHKNNSFFLMSELWSAPTPASLIAVGTLAINFFFDLNPQWHACYPSPWYTKKNDFSYTENSVDISIYRNVHAIFYIRKILFLSEGQYP